MRQFGYILNCLLQRADPRMRELTAVYVLLTLKGSLRMDSLELSTAQSPREDPLRILDPAQKKLGTIEAQRVMAVMEEAMKRLERILTLPFLAESLQRSVPECSYLRWSVSMQTLGFACISVQVCKESSLHY